jgi:hypothetical protein
MALNRRTFLKGLALSGFAATTPAFASRNMLSNNTHSPKEGTGLPIVALISGAPEEAAFLAGARFAQQQHSSYAIAVLRSDLRFDFLQSLYALLSGKPTHLLGLVNDASAAIIINLARAADVRMHWLGQHTASAEYSRHHILTADTGYGCGLRLGQQLKGQGASFSLTEQSMIASRSLHQNQIASSLTQPSYVNNSHWAALLGFTLANLSASAVIELDWPNASVMSTSAPLLGNFVSFSFENRGIQTDA